MSQKRAFFDAPHPAALIVAGVLFAVMGFVLAPGLGPQGHRAIIDPFTASAPVWTVEAVMALVGLTFIVQGIGTILRRRGGR
ncbi:hypothetical protein LQK89_02690 [Curtobacterium sp. C1]|uniref:hypothetical protein n=1 Tax=Curtobacterium sp. C1 TaxID=2898151 RepID=UPI001E457F05|nr:hypothetical protein [Curtobacterium sp. C1]UFU14626.1 hypothetical protein LQK89_02690 [Curtobacterium sp. C1]